MVTFGLTRDDAACICCTVATPPPALERDERPLVDPATGGVTAPPRLLTFILV